MKQILFSILFAGLLLGGCTDVNNSTAPEQNGNTIKMFKMPQAVDMSTEAVFSSSKSIDGNLGGDLQLNGKYQTATGVVTIQASLNVPASAYSGEKVLNVANSNLYAEIDFDPTLSFKAPVLLNATVTGLNLSDISNPEDIYFAYISDDGSYIEPVSCDKITVDVANGTLSVTNAHLSHFSRYIWAR